MKKIEAVATQTTAEMRQQAEQAMSKADYGRQEAINQPSESSIDKGSAEYLKKTYHIEGRQ